MRLATFLLILITFTTTYSQDFSNYKWNQRIIVVQSPGLENMDAMEQLDLLKKEQKQLTDFKLIVFHQTNDGYKSLTSLAYTNSNFEKENISSFKVKLIGLDGTVKYTSQKLQPAQTFFDLINTMPMRRVELRKNKTKHD